ncbi:hypothetical protein Droror1_Dr00015396 [Drosera rotundifolia]
MKKIKAENIDAYNYLSAIDRSKNDHLPIDGLVQQRDSSATLFPGHLVDADVDGSYDPIQFFNVIHKNPVMGNLTVEESIIRIHYFNGFQSSQTVSVECDVFDTSHANASKPNHFFP